MGIAQAARANFGPTPKGQATWAGKAIDNQRRAERKLGLSVEVDLSMSYTVQDSHE